MFRALQLMRQSMLRCFAVDEVMFRALLLMR